MLRSYSSVRDTLRIVESAPSRALTAAFSRGAVTIDLQARILRLSRKFDVALPSGFQLPPSLCITVELETADGSLRGSPRKLEFIATGPESGSRAVFSAAGLRQRAERTPEESRRYTTLRFRAYMSHPGVETDTLYQPRSLDPGEVAPDSYWLTDSLVRQAKLWNRLVAGLREALDECHRQHRDELKQLLEHVVIPGIVGLSAQGELTGKLHTYLKRMRTNLDDFSIFELKSFAGSLKTSSKSYSAQLDHVRQRVLDFVATHPINYGPLHNFFRDVAKVRETDEPSLKWYERADVVSRFQRSLRARETARRNGQAFSLYEGWPREKRLETLLLRDWCFYYRTQLANEATLGLTTPNGCRGLRLDDPRDPKETGSPGLLRGFAMKQLRQATISLEFGRKQFRIAVLVHRRIPGDALLKAWFLEHSAGQYSLGLVLQKKTPQLPARQSGVARIEVSVAPAEGYIEIAKLYWSAIDEPISMGLTLGDERRDPAARPRFTAHLGANRIARHRLKRIEEAMREGDLDRAESIQLRGIDSLHGFAAIASKRRQAFQEARSHFASLVPPHRRKAALEATYVELRRLATRVKQTQYKNVLDEWLLRDRELTRTENAQRRKLVRRLTDAYCVIADDVSISSGDERRGGHHTEEDDGGSSHW